MGIAVAGKVPRILCYDGFPELSVNFSQRISMPRNAHSDCFHYTNTIPLLKRSTFNLLCSLLFAANPKCI
jgi:hypothetical protein